MNGRNGIGGWKRHSYKTDNPIITIKVSRELYDKIEGKLTDQQYGGFEGITALTRSLLSEWANKK